MAKADKSLVLRRNQEILRLILAGGEFEDIRQYAAAQGWKLSERQLRRYQETAHQQLAESIRGDRRQLLGRHLMQRRALYARAVKVNDIRTALQVLRDEALLEGLYPSANGGSTQEQRYLQAPAPISREERFRRTLAAEAAGDQNELALMEHLTPNCSYRMDDLTLPRQMLNLIALTYAADQLDRAAMFFLAVTRVQANEDANGNWDFIGGCHAYRFKVEVDAWDKFTGNLGVDGQKLVKENHQGSMLELFADVVYGFAAGREEFMARLEKEGEDPTRFPTAEGLAEQWLELLREVLKG
jgi:hypothetical protein